MPTDIPAGPSGYPAGRTDPTFKPVASVEIGDLRRLLGARLSPAESQQRPWP